MNPEIVFRITLALGIVGVGLLVYWLANRLILGRASLQAVRLEALRPGKPTLLYFTTPTCAPCKTVQRPAIQRLVDQLSEQLQVVEIDASANPDLASQWGVMSVPTTFVLDANGRPRHVNHGVAPAEKLLKQLKNMNQEYF
jgi:thioredoxin-like negative regulator of GroEL